MTDRRTIHESEMNRGALGCRRCGGWGYRWVENNRVNIRVQCNRCGGSGDEPQFANPAEQSKENIK